MKVTIFLVIILVLLMEAMDSEDKKDEKSKSECRLSRAEDILVVNLMGGVTTPTIAGKIVYLIKDEYLPVVSEKVKFDVFSNENGISAVLMAGIDGKTRIGEIRIIGFFDSLPLLQNTIMGMARKNIEKKQ